MEIQHSTNGRITLTFEPEEAEFALAMLYTLAGAADEDEVGEVLRIIEILEAGFIENKQTTH